MCVHPFTHGIVFVCVCMYGVHICSICMCLFIILRVYVNDGCIETLHIWHICISKNMCILKFVFFSL